jgi:mannose-6-phosphate isomerase-like protein (cupin superfamily)
MDRRKMLSGSLALGLVGAAYTGIDGLIAEAAGLQQRGQGGAAQPRTRRVVTGNNAQGKSYAVSDEIVSGGAITSLFDTSGDSLTGPYAAGESHDLLAGDSPQLEPALGGSKLLFVTLPPRQGDGGNTAMHRTWTVDYNIVLSGELVLILEMGQVTLKPGDVVIQRNTLHAWRNNSTTEPIRWVAVLLPVRKQA